jgi:hypothetical protein
MFKKIPIMLVLFGLVLTPIWATILGWLPMTLLVATIKSLHLLLIS